MLINFKTSNYKSFAEEMTFSMIPAPRLSDLKYSVLNETIGNKQYRALCSAIVYGPNAAGKTNVIEAMDTFRSILIQGHIKNNNQNLTNFAANSLELIPFFKTNSVKPISFSISFIEQNILFEYSVSIEIGKFLEVDYERRILTEELKINNEPVFYRQGNDLKLFISHIKKWLNNEETIAEEKSKHKLNIGAIAEGGLNEQELFLMNGFKTVISKSLVTIIYDWLSIKFVTICRANELKMHKKVNEEKRNILEIDENFNAAAKVFGINSNELGFINPEKGGESKLVSVMDINGKQSGIPAEIFESYGTLRFVTWFPLVANALLSGGTIVIDEFDASIHPMALMSIINIFHNDNINIHNAQLIFNTHNPIFLNANLYRRDEIKFVERNEETGVSELYQLSDFGTSGDKGVRKGEDYLGNYFVNQYGAIRDIDFSSIFEKMISSVK